MSLDDPRARPQKAIDQRWLQTVLGASLWFITTAVIVGASFVPEVAPDNINFWRLVLAVPAIVFGLLNLFVAPKLSERTYRFWLEMNMVPALAVHLVLLQITPATEVILSTMLVVLIYAGYFLRPLGLTLTLVGAVGISLSTLFTDPASQSPAIGSFLVVYIPTMVITTLLLHLQDRETSAALERAQHHSLTDPLTGLANLRGIKRAAETALVPKSSSKDDTVVGLLLIDLENFKSANTQHGHLGGDHALRMVGQQMQRVAPRSAVAARVGGDEFAVLVRERSSARITEVGEIFAGAVRAAGSILEMPGVELDAAIGVAIYPEDGRDLNELLDTAGRSMYEQKGPKPPLAAVEAPAPSAEGDRPSWMDSEDEDDEQSEPVTLDLITGKNIPALASRSLYARTSALAYAIGTVLLAASLLVPDAYPDPALDPWSPWLILIGGLAISAGIFLINPQPQTKLHLAFDFFALVGLALLTAMTGGYESTVPPLLILLVASQAWFWQTRRVVLRVVGPSLVAMSPLLYSSAPTHTETVIAWVTMYAEAAMIATLVAAMFFNRWLLTRLQARAELLASIDPLTGVQNRRAFDACVLELLADESDVEQFAIVMLDLDNFKQVNTTQGHRAGDNVLIEAARSLLAAAREEDCVARVGGDEFAVVLPGVGVDGARTLAEGFVAAIAMAPAAHGAGVSASAGFALNPLHGDTLDELVFTADGALMAVKASAKGTARVARVVSAV